MVRIRLDVIITQVSQETTYIQEKNKGRKETKPEYNARTSRELKATVGRDNLITNDMPEIPWKVSSPRMTCNLYDNQP